MEYQEWIPSNAAASGVRCCWRLQSGHADAAAQNAEPALPDGCPELILNFADPFEHVAADGSSCLQPQAFLVGQLTRPLVVRPTGAVDLLAVRFEADGASVLHPNLSKLRDSWADARTLREPVATLHHRLVMLAADERHHALAAWIASLAPSRAGGDNAVAQVVQAIRQSKSLIELHDVAIMRGVSVRTLQRRFVTQVGVSPKLLARILRFHHVCVAWRRAPETMARVAADYGYCDESHLVRDFRSFVGEPPAAFLAQLPVFSALFLSPGTPRGRTG